MREKNFGKTIHSDEDVWQINSNGWYERKYHIGDLEYGQEKYIPLMHLIGTNRYMHTAYISISIEWDNPITKEHERIEASKMLPSDEWQVKGLVFYSQ